MSRKQSTELPSMLEIRETAKCLSSLRTSIVKTLKDHGVVYPSTMSANGTTTYQGNPENIELFAYTPRKDMLDQVEFFNVYIGELNGAMMSFVVASEISRCFATAKYGNQEMGTGSIDLPNLKLLQMAIDRFEANG